MRVLPAAVAALAWTLALTGANAVTITPSSPGPATYAGSMTLDASGYICRNFSCAPQNVTVNKPAVPGTVLGNTGQVPLISDGTIGSAIPPVNLTNAASASGSITISQQPSPSIYLTASETNAARNGVLADFLLNPSINYFMEVLGAPGSVSVKINASGGASVLAAAAGAYSNNIAQANFSVTKVGGGQVLADTAYLNAYGGNYAGPASNTFVETGTYVFQTNTLYSVLLSGYLSSGISGNLGGGTETLSAFVDPQFSIASGDPSLYQFDFSAGIGNSVGAVPESSTWVMLLLGFCGLGFLAYRRKDKLALSAA